MLAIFNGTAISLTATTIRLGLLQRRPTVVMVIMPTLTAAPAGLLLGYHGRGLRTGGGGARLLHIRLIVTTVALCAVAVVVVVADGAPAGAARRPRLARDDEAGARGRYSRKVWLAAPRCRCRGMLLLLLSQGGAAAAGCDGSAGGGGAVRRPDGQARGCF